MSICIAILEVKIFPGRSITNNGDNCIVTVLFFFFFFFGECLKRAWGSRGKNKDKIGGHEGVGLISNISPTNLISIFCSTKNTFRMLFFITSLPFGWQCADFRTSFLINNLLIYNLWVGLMDFALEHVKRPDSRCQNPAMIPTLICAFGMYVCRIWEYMLRLF